MCTMIVCSVTMIMRSVTMRMFMLTSIVVSVTYVSNIYTTMIDHSTLITNMFTLRTHVVVRIAAICRQISESVTLIVSRYILRVGSRSVAVDTFATLAYGSMIVYIAALRGYGRIHIVDTGAVAAHIFTRTACVRTLITYICALITYTSTMLTVIRNVIYIYDDIPRNMTHHITMNRNRNIRSNITTRSEQEWLNRNMKIGIPVL